ncbi:MAG: hypothetical protein MZU95_07010 [Desulfomicrobium escambiense]|nr:hypothetical protein [Desulfomicrobium escambiense]
MRDEEGENGRTSLAGDRRRRQGDGRCPNIIDKCPDCRAEADAYERLVRGDGGRQGRDPPGGRLGRLGRASRPDRRPGRGRAPDSRAPRRPRGRGLARRLPHDAGPGRAGRRPRRRRRRPCTSP